MSDPVEELLAELAASPPAPGAPRRTLLTGWFSFRDGEVTAGDVLALRRVEQALERAGVPFETAWSPGFAPEALSLDAVDPGAFSHLVFVCGPAHGPQVVGLHERFAGCRRIAVDVSVVSGRDPAVAGFDAVLTRDGGGAPPRVDLSAHAPGQAPPPVVAVVLTSGQGEYRGRRRHDDVSDALTEWLRGTDCARLPLDTRLATDDWRLCATPEQYLAVVRRTDLVVTTRLHGLVLALRAGVPALAVDPVAGGAKVWAQARACRWPAALLPEEVSPATLRAWWSWCLSPRGRGAAVRRERWLRRGRLPEAAEAVAGTGGAGDGPGAVALLPHR
ncbi:polysaccharide pyruvyl transferase family protein [Streptomyces sp. NPDC059740]|uniref:polysaccharide pyruvyl transferase family protein n=1 Tax=Streptomyces sp. NPDC059740 TaxID=3346926 RepID=UPI003661C21F